MAVDVGELCRELTAETAELDRMLSPLDDSRWATPTPAEGWLIRDQVSHLAFFDDRAVDALTDARRFAAERDAALADGDGLVDRAALANVGRRGPELLDWLRRARHDLIEAAGSLDPGWRVPWYGPDMSVASFMTARLMETWAHGQDVADALGTRRVPTDRLRHIAFLGFRALPNSYQARGRAVPRGPVRVELVGPGGDLWVFGPADAGDLVRGSALDFCLAVTQRRHLSDLHLDLRGPVAHEWLSIAQAFAGPPGQGRRPGQFRPADD